MKLLTKKIEQALPPFGANEKIYPRSDAKVITKFFTPDANATWLILEGEKRDDDWLLFAWCDLGDPDMAELGYLSLNELLSVRGALGLPVERDLAIEPNEKTLGDLMPSLPSWMRKTQQQLRTA